MLVETLKCTNFRNLSDIILVPCHEMNVICGENGQGKTNLVEAIWLFTGAKSFRTSKENAFLKIGTEKGKNELFFSSDKTEHSAVMEFGEKRSVVLNDKKISGPSKMAGKFYAIVFSPNDLFLITNGPAERRKFLDLAIGQLYPAYISVLRDYHRAVTQRNQIIHDYRYDKTLAVMLDIFEEKIARFGEKIVRYRIRFLENLKQYIPDIYFGLSGGREKIEIEYICSCNIDNIADELQKKRTEDMMIGATTIGPHRDDIEFKINGVSARLFASQGQRRSIALSVKLSQAEVIKSISGNYPVCLLDDVMSELDPTRQNYILNHIHNWQSFLTCCDPSNIKGLKNGKIFKISNGALIG